MTVHNLQPENAELCRRLAEAEETICAIQSGAVDAFVVEEPAGHRIYTLETADRPYRLFVEQMQQGAATLQADGTIVYCNRRLADMVKVPLEKLIGKPLHDVIATHDHPVYDKLLWQGQTRSGRGEAHLRRTDGGLVPAYLTFNALPKDCGAAIGVLITDLTAQRHQEQLTATLEKLRESEERVQRTNAELTERLTELQKAKVEIQNSYRATLDLMENAVQSRQRMETLNSELRTEVSQRKQAEQALGESDRRFREMIDVLPVAIYTTDAQGRLTHFNPAAVEFSGRTPELGTDQWCVSWKLYYPDGRPMPHDECPMAIALKENRIVRGAEAIAERPDGKRIWFEPYPTPLRDGEDRIVGGINMLLDITERKRAEQARAKLAAIVESSGDAIISQDLNSVITSWNHGAERLFGYAGAEAIGRPITILIPPDRLDDQPDILERICCGERIDRYETVCRRKDGTLLDISLTISPITDAQGKMAGASTIAHDITQRKQAEEALREADRRKNEFLAILAHELRNPLAPIRNAAQILRLKGSDNQAVQSASKMMERQVDQMVRLVDELLDVSRIGQGKIELTREPVELASLVRHAVEAARPQCDAKGVELTVTLPADPVRVEGDPLRLGQVVDNLLNNAFKFTEPDGRIGLMVELASGTDDTPSEGVIRVRDTGIGIAADQLTRIFHMFTQVDTSLERSVSGLGIGLTLVKNLVEMHGGTVEAHSAGVGRGSEFVVRLPILVETANPPQPEPTASERATTIPRRILIVDDLRDSAASLAMLLDLDGNETHTAHDGLEALEAAATFRPDVILLDIGLPKLNGFEVARKIREQPWGKGVVLVAVTGWGQEEDRSRSADAGFDYHMVKPVDYAALMKLLASMSSSTRTR